MTSLGLIVVPTPGTPVQIVATKTPVTRLNFQPIKSLGPVVQNTGAIYIGKQGMNKSTGAGVFYALASGQPGASMLPIVNATVGDDASLYYVDADTPNDGVLVSYA